MMKPLILSIMALGGVRPETKVTLAPGKTQPRVSRRRESGNEPGGYKTMNIEKARYIERYLSDKIEGASNLTLV
jgi:hypothetical protein